MRARAPIARRAALGFVPSLPKDFAKWDGGSPKTRTPCALWTRSRALSGYFFFLPLLLESVVDAPFALPLPPDVFLLGFLSPMRKLYLDMRSYARPFLHYRSI